MILLFISTALKQFYQSDLLHLKNIIPLKLLIQQLFQHAFIVTDKRHHIGDDV